MHTIDFFYFFKCSHFLENRLRKFRSRANFAASSLLNWNDNTRKKCILEKLPNSLETGNMRKIR